MNIQEKLDRARKTCPREREIHITDIQTFTTCRLKWYWSSPLGLHLQPRAIPEPLFIGQAVHLALRAYTPGEPMVFNLQRAIELIDRWAETRKKADEEMFGKMLPKEVEDIAFQRRTVIRLIRHYDRWVKAEGIDRGLTFVRSEFPFRVKIPHTRNYSVGFIDAIAVSSTGKIHLLEYKTVSNMTNAVSVMRGLQSKVYARALAEILEVDVRNIVVEYRFIAKRECEDLTPLVRGGFSKNRRQKVSSWHAINELRDAGEDLQEYAEFLQYLRETQDSKFFQRHYLHHTPATVRVAEEVLRHLSREMTTKREIPIFPLPGIHCAWCSFKTPCDLYQAGYIPEAYDVLDAEYAKREYWDEGLDALGLENDD